MTRQEYLEAHCLLRERIIQLRAEAIVLGEHEPDAARATMIAGCYEAAEVLVKALNRAQQEARGEAERKGATK